MRQLGRGYMLALDEPLRQLGHIRKEKIFHLFFTVTALLCSALLKKNNKFSGLKGLNSHSF